MIISLIEEGDLSFTFKPVLSVLLLRKIGKEG